MMLNILRSESSGIKASAQSFSLAGSGVVLDCIDS